MREVRPPAPSFFPSFSFSFSLPVRLCSSTMISSSSSVQGVCCVCGWVGNEGEREKRGVFGRRYGRWSLSTFCLLLKKGNDAAATRALFSLLLYPVDVGPQLVVPPFPALLAHSTREVDGQVGPAALAPLLDEAGWMKRREKGGVFIYIYIFLMINVKKDAFGGRRKQWSACPSLPILVYANFQLATGAGMMARAGSSGRGSHPDKKRGSAQTSARPGAPPPTPPLDLLFLPSHRHSRASSSGVHGSRLVG